MAFKIDWCVGDAIWNGNAVALQQLALPLLGRRVVYLKDAKLRIRVSVGEGVESCTKQDVLLDSALDRLSQVVFGIAAAGDEKRTKRDREGPVGPHRGSPQFLCVSRAEERNRNRIVKYHGRVVNLVSRAVPATKAAKPNKVKLWLLGALIGLIIGVGSPLVYEILVNRRVRCRDDLERSFGVPVLSEFDEIKFAPGSA